MEWFATFLPIALLLLACGGLHLLMMRGLHRRHGAASSQGHAVHGVDAEERVQRLEDEVTRLRKELDAAKVAATGNGQSRAPVSAPEGSLEPASEAERGSTTSPPR